MKAIWNHQLLADSNKTIIIENNHYFPEGSLNREFFSKSETTSLCPWKGMASYYTITVNGKTNKDAAWYYSSPKETAIEIKNYIAFWNGVIITDSQ